jgi:flagellar biosynthesis protein FlhB
MAEGSEKTEKPTPKRIADARKKGQVAKSNDFNSALVLGAVVLLLMMYGSYFFQYLARLTREFLQHQLRTATSLNEGTFAGIFSDTMFHIIIVMAPFLVGVLLMGVLANLMQVKVLFTVHPLKPDLQKINPLKGLKRIFSQRTFVELIKGILKMVVVGYCAYVVIQSQEDHLMAMSHMGFAQAWALIFKTALSICATIAIALLVLGVADWWYQHYQLMKQLKMTRQEVKDELKNTEGNPEIKRRLKQTGHAMLRRRMLSAVQTADVVVTNPTHFAVAIQYDPDEAPAPRVVAKGADHMAFKIRELAQEHKVPIVENKPLARSLYSAVEVDHMIPPELFITVAEVLAYVFKRNRGRRNRHVRKIYQEGLPR